MGSIRNLKKQVTNVLGDILDAADVSQELIESVTAEQIDTFNEEVYSVYDKLIADINNNNKVENRKAHIKAVKQEFEEKAHSFVEQINAWK